MKKTGQKRLCIILFILYYSLEKAKLNRQKQIVVPRAGCCGGD